MSGEGIKEAAVGTAPHAANVTDDDLATMTALVRAQGSVFIRELFRQVDGLTVTGTKDELEARVLDALKKGIIPVDELRAWITSVEGWGHQRVYLRSFSDPGVLPVDLDDGLLGEKLAGASFAEVVGQDDSLDFPNELTPTGAVVRDGRVRLTWHARADRESRSKDKDFVDEIDGDTYVFKAYRIVPERHTMRLILDPDTGIGGLFVSIPENSSVDPSDAIGEAWVIASTLLGAAPAAVDLSRAIAVLADGDDDHTAVRRRHMEASGARVVFSRTAANDYRDSPEVAQVATTASAVQGMVNRAGDFGHSTAATDRGPTREIVVQINEQRGHVWVRAQVDEEQMWNLIHMVVTASSN